MRITDNLQAAALQQNVQTSLTTLNTIQQEISSGKQLNSPSDDPAGTAQDLALRESLLNNAQYENDANNASDFLKTTDTALSSAGSLLSQVRQIAVQGANGGFLSQDNLNALADQVDSAIQQLTNIANTNLHGKYVFGGAQTQTAPYAGSPPTYQGDEGAVVANIGPGQTLTLNSPGSNQSLFGDTFSALQTLKSDLQAGDSTAVSNDITAIDTRITATSAAQAAVGAKTNQVTAVTQNLQRLDTEYQSAQSSIEGVDLTQAYVQLQSAQNVYQASLVSVSKAYQYSLADYLG